MCIHTCVCFFFSPAHDDDKNTNRIGERARICRAKREGKKAIKNALCLRKFLTQSTAVVARDMDIYFAHLLNSLFSNISPNTLSSDSSFAAFVVVVAARFFFLSIFFRCFSPVVGVQSIYGSRSFVSLVIPLFGQRFRDFLSTDSFFLYAILIFHQLFRVLIYLGVAVGSFFHSFRFARAAQHWGKTIWIIVIIGIHSQQCQILLSKHLSYYNYSSVFFYFF